LELVSKTAVLVWILLLHIGEQVENTAVTNGIIHDAKNALPFSHPANKIVIDRPEEIKGQGIDFAGIESGREQFADGL